MDRASEVATGLTKTRWDGKRFNAYAEYGLAVKTYVNLLRRVAGDMGLDSVAHPLARSAGLPEIELAEGERAGVMEKVLLLGDQATINVARAWHRTAWELAYLAQGVSAVARPNGGQPWTTCGPRGMNTTGPRD